MPSRHPDSDPWSADREHDADAWSSASRTPLPEGPAPPLVGRPPASPTTSGASPFPRPLAPPETTVATGSSPTTPPDVPSALRDGGVAPIPSEQPAPDASTPIPTEEPAPDASADRPLDSVSAWVSRTEVPPAWPTTESPVEAALSPPVSLATAAPGTPTDPLASAQAKIAYLRSLQSVGTEGEGAAGRIARLAVAVGVGGMFAVCGALVAAGQVGGQDPYRAAPVCASGDASANCIGETAGTLTSVNTQGYGASAGMTVVTIQANSFSFDETLASGQSGTGLVPGRPAALRTWRGDVVAVRQGTTVYETVDSPLVKPRTGSIALGGILGGVGILMAIVLWPVRSRHGGRRRLAA